MFDVLIGPLSPVTQTSVVRITMNRPPKPLAPRRVVMRSEVEIWNTTPLFLLFVAALAAEWLLRKRYGLL